ncbi:unnamed protein product [Bursaphelenchus okinawaensis]|uniref:Integrase catalytic domain-containing protein n=1 Tax=Bursaphelenchus okinawaensis TaxID=465554 RepID=A0A811K3B3_9BILA|nr:unnamed protein product [Bursaphelenchus okinawaensis]CAG9091053.1 unnamed protein product [Bursaphelenchus okinawaensis]
MVVVDPFTKWLHALPIGDKRPETVAHAFVTSFIARYGIPVKVVSDNGCEFTGQAFQALIKQYGMTHLTTTPYHPAGNGQVERQNRTLADMLAHYVSTGGTDWNEFVPLVCYAFNTSTHPNTGYTPFELLYGRPPRSPIETEARELFSGEQENETESVPEVLETVNQPNLPGNQPNLQQEPKRTNKDQ